MGDLGINSLDFETSPKKFLVSLFVLTKTSKSEVLNISKVLQDTCRSMQLRHCNLQLTMPNIMRGGEGLGWGGGWGGKFDLAGVINTAEIQRREEMDTAGFA